MFCFVFNSDFYRAQNSETALTMGQHAALGVEGGWGSALLKAQRPGMGNGEFG